MCGVKATVGDVETRKGCLRHRFFSEGRSPGRSGAPVGDVETSQACLRPLAHSQRKKRWRLGPCALDAGRPWETLKLAKAVSTLDSQRKRSWVLAIESGLPWETLDLARAPSNVVPSPKDVVLETGGTRGRGCN